MEEGSLDFKRICRTCKCTSEKMINVFEDMEPGSTDPRIDEMLMACASIQVTKNDILPSVICRECSMKLTAAYAFKQQCEDADSGLREYSKKFIKQEQTEAELTSNLLNDLQKMLNFKPPKKAPPFVEPPTEDPTERCDFIEVVDSHMILTCRECYKVFTTIDGLRCHKRIHSGVLFKCRQCDKEYTRINHLQRHELTHGRRKVHICKICNKTLTRFEHLKRHLVTHLKEKPYSCKKCMRGFNRTEHLQNHVDKCKGNRVYICDICNKGFNRADSLEVHRVIHENTDPVLPTLDNLDNIEDHYMEMEYDENNVSIFADLEDEDFDDCLEPHVSITENYDDESDSDDGNDMNNDVLPHDSYDEDDKDEEIEEKAKIDDIIEDSKLEIKGEEPADGDYENESDPKDISSDKEQIIETDDHVSDKEVDVDVVVDSDSGHSEYTPKKVTQKKRSRGRPRKNFSMSPKSPAAKRVGKPGVPGRRGRPPGSGKSKTEIKHEVREPAADGVYHCTSCDEVFPTCSLLDKHMSTAHEIEKTYECKQCNKLFSRSTHLKRHLISHSKDKPYVCDICTKNFNRRDHLTQHMKLHSREQQFECDTCQTPFSRRDHLHKHILNKHSNAEKLLGVKKYKCEVCPKAFTTEKYMGIHMKVHTGEKKYRCKTCDKTFLSRSHLTEHVKFHNDNSKKFLCSECGQRFIRNDYLVIHMRRHRGEKPFKCRFCGKGFPRTTDLTVHERYHTGEKTHLCVICGRGFGRAYNLTVHMRTHTGEKPYQCTYCDAAFAQGNDLKAHVRRHTGERFQCELCSETFLMGYLLTQHKRSVHGLNVVSNIRRLQPINKDNPDDPPPITIPLPAPVVPSAILSAQLHAQMAQTQLIMDNE